MFGGSIEGVPVSSFMGIRQAGYGGISGEAHALRSPLVIISNLFELEAEDFVAETVLCDREGAEAAGASRICVEGGWTIFQAVFGGGEKKVECEGLLCRANG